jgi:tetratricopeptide (TPR) repeat protein
MRLLQGETELARGRAAEALSDFEIAHRVRPHARTLEALATAYPALNRNDEAASALAGLIARRTPGAESQQEWLMAHLQLGRLHERRGEPDEARQQYEALLTVWKDADPDLPAARDARQRLERLSQRAGS